MTQSSMTQFFSIQSLDAAAGRFDASARDSTEAARMAENNGWHVDDNGQAVGPMTLDELVARLPRHGGEGGLVYGPGLGAWAPAGGGGGGGGGGAPPRAPPPPPAP